VFIEAGGVVRGLYPRKLLADDGNVPNQASGFGGVNLSVKFT
jgi:hypothetical protein